MQKQKLGKNPLLTFIATFQEYGTDSSYLGSCFHIEGKTKDVVIPSSILRRNFPQAKTNTRLKIQFYPWEVDIGRTIWFKDYRPCGEMCYTFSRRGKVIQSMLPYPLQKYLKKNLGIKNGDTIRVKIAVTAI